ncbi:MAG: hypothetical protein ACTSYC_04035 [Promethearchaeota archaeon]
MILKIISFLLEEPPGFKLEGYDVDVELISIILLGTLFFSMLISRIVIKYLKEV